MAIEKVKDRGDYDSIIRDLNVLAGRLGFNLVKLRRDPNATALVTIPDQTGTPLTMTWATYGAAGTTPYILVADQSAGLVMNFPSSAAWGGILASDSFSGSASYCLVLAANLSHSIVLTWNSGTSDTSQYIIRGKTTSKVFSTPSAFITCSGINSGTQMPVYSAVGDMIRIFLVNAAGS